MCALIKGLSGTITPFVAVMILLVVSSILNKRKVELKFVASGALLKSFFWELRLLTKLKSRKE